MTSTTPDTDATTTIETLLQQRAQYEQWLARLDSTAEKAPPAVRQRVRADYEGRLHGVIEQLRGHAATIGAELERHRATQARLDGERREAEEALAEAEIRHAVGEYAEADWRGISDQAHQALERLRAELREVGTEIARLVEVQSLIGAPRREAAPAAAAGAAPAPSAEAPRAAPEPGADLASEAAAFGPAAGIGLGGSGRSSPGPKPATPAREPGVRVATREPGPAEVDELAFLKSVADEPTRPSAAGGVAPHPAPGYAAPAHPAPAHSAPAAVAQPGPSRTQSVGVAKTLKCGECGTLNRPTEWYCERCGAELAAV